MRVRVRENEPKMVYQGDKGSWITGLTGVTWANLIKILKQRVYGRLIEQFFRL